MPRCSGRMHQRQRGSGLIWSGRRHVRHTANSAVFVAQHQKKSEENTVMADIADEAQGAEEQLIAQGLTSIRAQLASSGTEECRICGVSIPERRRQLLPGVSTCVECQERREFYQKVGSVRVADNDAD
ncbi:hypothetical protein EXW94_24980 [Enterobacter sp. JMULE2]|nr:hypothetical protein [Enterobacter sp. JMULE2]